METAGDEKSPKQHVLEGLKRGALWSLGINGTLFVGGQTAAVMPHGHPLLMELGILAAPFVLGVVAAGALAPLGLLFPAWRGRAAGVLGMALTYIPIFLLCLVAASRLRSRAFLALADRSRPLVEAIGRYEAKRGAPPPSLEALVPEFLPAVPKTGMGSYPDYRYSTSTGTLSQFQPTPWVVYVHTPSGGINFDLFFYLPNKNYPDRVGGDPIERIGDWAYLHE